MSTATSESFVMELEDGKRVLFRPVRPEDRRRFVAGLELVSRESRHTRFFTPLSQLTEGQLDYLTDVDQVDHVAWGALDADDPGFPGYGVGRFVRHREDTEAAEIAVVIIDAFQGRGLGKIFFALLYLLARERGLKALRADIMPANQFMADWVRDLGGEIRRGEGAIQLRLPILDDLSGLPDSDRARRFRRTLEEVHGKLFGEGE